MFRRNSGVLGITLAAAFAATAAADDATHFVTPAYWNPGDLYSTYQEWDVLTSSLNNAPDVGYVTNPTIGDSPTLSAVAPGFVTGSNNFYSFSGNYGFESEIFNYGGAAPSGYGTHVIIQTAGTMNPDPNAGGPASVFIDSLRLIEPNAPNATIPGGAFADALRAEEIWQGMVSSSFGDVDQQEQIWEFYLPNYTGGFRVVADNIVHCSFMQLRVDTIVVAEAFDTTALPCDEDINGDGEVNLTDLGILLGHYGMPEATLEDGDLNGDETVDLTDLGLLLGAYGAECG